MSDGEPLAGAFEAVVDATPGGVYRRSIGGEQAVRTADDGIEALVGVDAAALDGSDRGWLDVVHPDDRDAVRVAVADAGPGQSVETTYRILTDDGDVRRVRDRFAVADDATAIEGVVLEATEADGAHAGTEESETADGEAVDAESEPVDAESEATESGWRSTEGDPVENEAVAMLNGIFDAVPVHVYVKDASGRHRLVSDFLERSDELLGKRDVDLDFVDDEHARRAHEADMRVIETEEPILDEEEYLPEIGHWNLSSKVPLRDAEGEVIGLIGVTRRITERKRAQQELRRKTERLEDFADVVAHDIRNPLSVARGYADLAAETGDVDDHLDDVADALDRAGDIVDDVLALSRHGHMELEETRVSLADVARSAWRSVATGSATLSLPDDDVELTADRSQLSRLLENLFKNSVDHAGDDVSIAVESIPGGFAVEDDGPGIPETERERVFEPAYTTSESGSGLGLGIVAEVADAHDWSVSVSESALSEGQSEASGGARFELTGVDVAGGADA